jgi:hypothetical protein
MPKLIFRYLSFFVIITIIWNIILHIFILPNYFVKTEATVIDIARVGRGGSRGSLPDNLPIYTYTDDKGELRTYYSRDGFNVINGVLFKKEVGKHFVAYYEKGSREGLFITGTGDWLTFILGPLVVAIFPFGIIFAGILYFRRKTMVYKKS